MLTAKHLAPAVTALALWCLSTPAGIVQPMILRVVTIDGITGPAYYSSVERRYRFVQPVERSRHDGGLRRDL